MINQATIKSIQDIMRKDVGVDGDAQRLGQMVWMIFLKVLDDREVEWELLGSSYTSPLPEDLRWRRWAADDEGLTGDSLLDFVNLTLFPRLKSLKPRRGSNPDLTQVVQSVFEDAYNYMKSGTLLRQALNVLQRDLDYNTNEDRHAFGDIYENLLKGLQSAGDAGEYYTPRPVTEFMVEMSDPKLGEVMLDPAAGTGGFLLCTLNHVRDRYVDSVSDDEIAQQSIHGVEKKPLPHLLCVTNMLLHGVDVPTNIRHDNTLARPLRDYGPSDRVDLVLTNPPFQGMEEDGIENNFPASVRTKETSDLFLALTLHILKQRGRAAIVLPDSSLFGEGVKQVLRGRLLSEANLHTIVRLPHGVFSPYTDIRTNLLFFDKGNSTDEVWFYELTPPTGEKYTKTKPIKPEDFDELRSWWNDRRQTESAWAVPSADISAPRFHLDLKNPAAADVEEAYQRGLSTRTQAMNDIEVFRSALEDSMKGAPGPFGQRPRDFLQRLSELGTQAALGSGMVEDLRVAMTGFALQGDLSERLANDEPIEETLSRYVPAERKEIPPFNPPPFNIPKHWSWVPLTRITDFHVGRTPSTSNHYYWADPLNPEIDWVSISDMPRRGLVDATLRTVTPKTVDEVFKRRPVPAGSLLMAFKLSLGKTCITAKEAYHNEAIASMSTQDEVLKRYLLWALPHLTQYAGSNPAVRGSTLNSKSISAMWIPVPPAQEQERIVTNLRWAVELIEDLAYRSEEVRESSRRLMKLLVARSRPLIQ
ncbi:N-6 DNA methylase [Kocuria flava]|uniref:N-6 DNA methylase n=1 Tax=Kocuria flava TaxID=446860 RepID=UPI002F94159F